MGGGGLFIQYHDVVSPLYLTAILHMIKTQQHHGLLFEMINSMPPASIAEWYITRKYINPLQCLDINHKLDPNDLDKLMIHVLKNNPIIYKYSPPLNLYKMLSVFKIQRIAIPVYIYSPYDDPNIQLSCKYALPGISYTYIHGDIEKCLEKCNKNYTYIFSDINLMTQACDHLSNKFAHVLLCRDWRYNYNDVFQNLKISLDELVGHYPFSRISLTQSYDITDLIGSIENILYGRNY